MTKPTVLITGASGGLGKALVHEFLMNNWMVTGTDIHDEIQRTPDNAFRYLQADLKNKEDIWKVCDMLKEDTPQLDLLINNAVVQDFFPLSTGNDDRIYEIFQVNTFAMLHFTRCFLPLLRSAGGRIINISSESVKFPGLFQPYQASKIAMEALHKTLRQELFLTGIKMILIRPGAIKTSMLTTTKNMAPLQPDSLFYNEFNRFSKLAVKYIGRPVTAQQMAKKIYRVATKKNPRGVYHYNNNPLLTFMSKVPEGWMLKFVKNSVKR